MLTQNKCGTAVGFYNLCTVYIGIFKICLAADKTFDYHLYSRKNIQVMIID
jgi:hypothetical protein